MPITPWTQMSIKLFSAAFHFFEHIVLNTVQDHSANFGASSRREGKSKHSKSDRKRKGAQKTEVPPPWKECITPQLEPSKASEEQYA